MSTPVSFTVDGRTLELRLLSGAEAYELAAAGDWLGLFPGAVLDEDDQNWLRDRFDDAGDPLTLRSLWRIAHGIAPSVYGVQWWSACRLASAITDNWMAFEVWSVRHSFDRSAPWLSPQRLTAAAMAWLLSTCEKDVEWQRVQVDIEAPPAYAVHLTGLSGDGEGGHADASSFQQNAPHWIAGMDQQPAESGGDGAEEPEPEAAPPPWAGQPVLTMQDFQAQAQEWSQQRRTERAVTGAAQPQESG
ncbi:hypothetical protein ACFV42_23250 [Streptomyces solisilvae]|uniref:hypothetical protein n=1 Tax=Streptomyces malaysiensis TaxID=92644 RepID=UPI00369AF260